MKRLMILTTLLLSIGTAYSDARECPEGGEPFAALTTTLTTPQNFTCDAVMPQSLNLESFREAANAYINWLSQPETPSKFPLCVLQKNPELWETLMLYQRRLQSPAPTDAVVEDAFLHYVINKPCSKLADEETANLWRLLNSYRSSLLLKKETAGEQSNHSAWTLRDLRSHGQKANMDRYGRGDIVPTGLLNFAESSDEYSHLNAVWMAEMSALAYWTPAKKDNPYPELIENQLKKWGYTHIADITDSDTDTSAYLAAKDNHLVLSFRGTSSWPNFFTDVKIKKARARRWAKGDIHSGFKSALDAVWPQIETNLEMPGQQQKKLWVTGHSLGAALAQLAALRLEENGHRVQAVYTFGTPLVGDANFVAFYDERLGDRTFPHINHRDLVPLVPPSWLGFSVTASSEIRHFTGTDHTLVKRRPKRVGGSDKDDGLWEKAKRLLQDSTRYLPRPLQPTGVSSGPPVEMNLYAMGEPSKKDPVNEHGSFEYLFKLACAALEKDLWPSEIERADVYRQSH